MKFLKDHGAFIRVTPERLVLVKSYSKELALPRTPFAAAELDAKVQGLLKEYEVTVPEDLSEEVFEKLQALPEAEWNKPQKPPPALTPHFESLRSITFYTAHTAPRSFD